MIDDGHLHHLYRHQIVIINPFEIFGDTFLFDGMDGIEEYIDAVNWEEEMVYDGEPEAYVDPDPGAEPEAVSASASAEPEVEQEVCDPNALPDIQPVRKRFAKPKSRADLEELADHRQAKSTIQQTKWGIKIFRGTNCFYSDTSKT